MGQIMLEHMVAARDRSLAPYTKLCLALCTLLHWHMCTYFWALQQQQQISNILRTCVAFAECAIESRKT